MTKGKVFSAVPLRRRDQKRLEKRQLAFRAIPGPLYSDGVKPTDARQGFIGDCYLLCAFSAVARSNPQHFESMIKKNGGGAFRFSFYKKLVGGKFQRESVTVDRKVPVDVSGARAGKPIYVRTLPDVRGRLEIWPLVAEKAYAAWKGGYHVMGEGGAVEDTLEELMGEPTRMIYMAEHHPEVLWKLLGSAAREKWPTTVCTYGRVERPGLDELGFHPNHIHIFMGVHAWRGKRIVWLRDPFDKPMCGKLNMPDPDGVFTISWETFLTYFAEIHINGKKAFDIPSKPYPAVTISQALDRSYVFHPLDIPTRRRLAQDFKRITVPADDYVIQAGEDPDAYYLIQSGSAGVEVLDKPSGRKRRVSVLNAGDQFGEMAILNNSKRLSDVKSITPMVLYKISDKKFRKWIFKHPELVQRFRRRFELQLWMQKWSHRPVTSLSLDNLLQAGKEESCRKGHLIIRQGDMAESFYLLLEGRVEIFARIPGKGIKRIKILESGEIFGEAAALKRLPRAASVRALAPCKLLQIDMTAAASIMESFELMQRQLEFIAKRRTKRLRKLRAG